jgi:hypothetical protein
MPKTKDQKRFDAICRMLDSWDGSYRSLSINRQIELLHVLNKLSPAAQEKIRAMYPAYFVGRNH